jgi:PPOX class probable F420-dependent enzyme
MPIQPDPMTPAIRAFLEPARFASIATVDPDGAPRQAVAWYGLEADGRILLNSRTPRRWCTNLLRDPRISLSIVDAADGYRWLGLTGVVEEVIDELERARDDIVALAHRYHPEGPTASSIATFRSQPRVTFLVRVTAVHDHLDG